MIKDFFTNITVYQIVISIIGVIVIMFVGYKTYKCKDEDTINQEKYNRIFNVNHDSRCKSCGSKIGINENVTLLNDGVLCSHCGRDTEQPLKDIDENIKKRLENIKKGEW